MEPVLPLLALLLLLLPSPSSPRVLPDGFRPDPPRFFVFGAEDNATELAGRRVSRGKLQWKYLPDRHAEFTVVPDLVDGPTANQIISLLEHEQFDMDLDTVDGLATFEYYLEKNGGQEAIRGIPGKPDADPSIASARAKTRAAVAKIVEPIMETLTEIVNIAHNKACGKRRCIPCFSLIRRYAANGENTNRTTHDTHFDEQALVTAVISLTTHGKDFTGGLYVATGRGYDSRHFLPLTVGDVVLHQSDLLHGVEVLTGVRWSWIIWFKNAGVPEKCDSVDRRKWTQRAAKQGDPVAQYLHARRSHSKYKLETWLRRSAKAGFRMAQNELGVLLRDRGEPTFAQKWLTSAAQSEPDAMLNLAMMRLRGGADEDPDGTIELLRKAAHLGQADAMTNLGVAHYKGYGNAKKDITLALAWWQASARPEATMSAVSVLRGGGKNEEATKLLRALGLKGHPEACNEMLRLILKTVDGRISDLTIDDVQEGLKWAKLASAANGKIPDDIRSYQIALQERLTAHKHALASKSEL